MTTVPRAENPARPALEGHDLHLGYAAGEDKVLPPRSGTVLLDGREISSMHPKVFVRQVGFLAQPRILLLDEPTTYLDLAHQVEVSSCAGSSISSWAPRLWPSCTISTRPVDTRTASW